MKKFDNKVFGRLGLFYRVKSTNHDDRNKNGAEKVGLNPSLSNGASGGYTHYVNNAIASNNLPFAH